MSPVTVPFVDTNPSLESCWRAIILLGKNTACYKFALAQALLEVNRQNTKIDLETIALPYAKHIANHLKSNRSGDVKNPRGGVRHVISGKGNYSIKDLIKKEDLL